MVFTVRSRNRSYNAVSHDLDQEDFEKNSQAFDLNNASTVN